MSNCCLYFMPILILLEGILYLGLSIWGLVMRECSSQITDIAQNPFGYVTDLVYFYDKMCGSPKINVAGLTATYETVNWQETTIDRTLAFLICYLVISALWIFISLWVIMSLSCEGKKSYKILSYSSWFIIVMAGCILDAVATGFHIHDIFHTTSATRTFNYLGISTSTTVMNAIRCFDEYFVTPSLVMCCISSRIVFIWLLNVFGSCYCISKLNEYLKERYVATSSLVLISEANAQTPVRG